MDGNLSLARVDKSSVAILISALRPLVKLRRSMPFPFVMTFLAIALEEGKTQSDYARDAGIHRYMMSRYLHSIGDYGRDGGAGLGLISLRRDPEHAQKHRIYLTAKGRAIAAEIFHSLGHSQSSSQLPSY